MKITKQQKTKCAPKASQRLDQLERETDMKYSVVIKDQDETRAWKTEEYQDLGTACREYDRWVERFKRVAGKTIYSVHETLPDRDRFLIRMEWISVTLETVPEVTILWNGGWDTYLVDPSRVRDLTPEEMAKEIWPTCSGETWLKGSFIHDRDLSIKETQAVRIIQHIGGGD